MAVDKLTCRRRLLCDAFCPAPLPSAQWNIYEFLLPLKTTIYSIFSPCPIPMRCSALALRLVACAGSEMNFSTPLRIKRFRIDFCLWTVPPGRAEHIIVIQMGQIMLIAYEYSIVYYLNRVRGSDFECEKLFLNSITSRSGIDSMYEVSDVPIIICIHVSECYKAPTCRLFGQPLWSARNVKCEVRAKIALGPLMPVEKVEFPGGHESSWYINLPYGRQTNWANRICINQFVK